MPALTVDWSLAFEKPAAAEAAAYWFSLRGDRTMPLRRELNPSAMRRFLIFTNLVTVCGEGPGAYRIALQGQHTCGLFGLVANRNLTEILSAEEEERWRHCFDLVRNGERPVRLATRVGTKGLLWLDCETFIAPLSDKGAVSFFWVFVSWIAEQPYGV